MEQGSSPGGDPAQPVTARPRGGVTHCPPAIRHTWCRAGRPYEHGSAQHPSPCHASGDGFPLKVSQCCPTHPLKTRSCVTSTTPAGTQGTRSSPQHPVRPWAHQTKAPSSRAVLSALLTPVPTDPNPASAPSPTDSLQLLCVVCKEPCRSEQHRPGLHY